MKNIQLTRTNLTLALAYIDSAILQDARIERLKKYNEDLSNLIDADTANQIIVDIVKNDALIAEARVVKNAHIAKYCECIRELVEQGTNHYSNAVPIGNLIVDNNGTVKAL